MRFGPLNEAWREVTEATIKNCYKHAFSVNKEDVPDVLADLATPLDMDRDTFEALVEQDVEYGQISDQEEDEEEEEEEEEEANDDDVNEVKVSPRECLEALTKVRASSQGRNFNFFVYDGLTAIQNQCLIEAREKQVPKINSFFK